MPGRHIGVSTHDPALTCSESDHTLTMEPMTSPRAALEADASDHGRSHTMQAVLGVGLALVSGLAMAVQGRLNGMLGAQLHDSMLAAVISFGGGLVLLLLALPMVPAMSTGLGNLRMQLRARNVRPWHCLGGLGGATFVAAQSLTVATIGVATFTVGVVAGQTLSGLLVDRVGLGPAGPQALTWTRILGAALTLGGVAGALSGGISASGTGLWLLILPLFGGACMAVQQAINGQVGQVAHSPMTAALVNFAVGTAVLILAWLLSLALRGGASHAWPHNPVLYLGGLAGVVFISVAVLVVKWTGVLLLALSAIAGQLIGSVLLDLLLPAQGSHLSVSTLLGVGVTLFAVVITTLGGRQRR